MRSVSFTQVTSGWIVKDYVGNEAEVLDDHGGIVHRIRQIKGPVSTRLEYAFNWDLAKCSASDDWKLVIKPEHIRAYRL